MRTSCRTAVPVLLAASIAVPLAADDAAPKGAPSVQMTKVAAPQAAPDTVDPKAKAIHDRGVESLRKLKALELTSVLAVEGIDPSMIPPGITDPAHVVIDFQTSKPAQPAERGGPGPTPFGRLAMDSSKGGKPTGKFAYDGKGAIIVGAPHPDQRRAQKQPGFRKAPVAAQQKLGDIGSASEIAA